MDEEEEACSVSNEEEVGVALLTDSAPFCMWEGSRTDCRDGRIASSGERGKRGRGTVFA